MHSVQIVRVPQSILKALLDLPPEAKIVGVTMAFEVADEIVFKCEYHDEQTGESRE